MKGNFNMHGFKCYKEKQKQKILYCTFLKTVSQQKLIWITHPFLHSTPILSYHSISQLTSARDSISVDLCLICKAMFDIFSFSCSKLFLSRSRRERSAMIRSSSERSSCILEADFALSSAIAFIKTSNSAFA